MADEEVDPNATLKASLLAAAAEKRLQEVSFTSKLYISVVTYLHHCLSTFDSL